MYYFYKIVLKSYEEGFEFFNFQIANKGTKIPVNSKRSAAETTRWKSKEKKKGKKEGKK